MLINTLLAGTPILLSCGAVIALRTSWRRPGLIYQMLTALAALLTLAAIALWAQRVGLEFAIIYALLTVIFMALFVIACNCEFRPVKPQADKLPTRYGGTTLRYKLAGVIIVGPLTLVAACLTTIVLVNLLSIARHSQLALSAFCYPFVFALIVHWLCHSTKLPRNSLLLLATCGAASAYLFL